ncbi:aldo/keto reductase [Streptomyces sp. NPDC001642]|uniref:aldo/keto reductase n=1 Tax=Streptomyces sp. NPDC001642 TaxID=3154392 RepID=UPI00331AE62C
MEVSAIALGCMSFGEPDRGGEPWSLGADASLCIIRQALENGVNFLDRANGYSAGSSEEIVGQAVKDFTRREEVVLSTKVWMRMRPGPNGAGLSRKAIFAQLDASLRRLETDYIDLYQIHRWDYDTPIEETLEAPHDAVRSGKVRYIGASSMYAWQFAKALFLAEMLPLCADQGIGVIPWSPLARSRLTRVRDAATARAETDEGGRILYRDEDQAVAERVHEIAGKRGLSPAQVALAWVIRNPAVTSPVVGVTKPAQLADAVAAVDVELDKDAAAYLEEPYQPHQAA